MTPCYYCEPDKTMCKTCIHSDTYIDPEEEITKLREQGDAQAAVIEALRSHLKVIAGLQLCADNLMSNSDIAAKALTIPTDSTQILAEVRRAERERVAQYVQQGTGDWMLGKKIAAAIRAME